MAETLRCYRHPDRETGLSCSECGRADLHRLHDLRPGRDPLPRPRGQGTRARRQVVQNVPADARAATRRIVTKTLIGINVGIYLLQLAGGAPINGHGGWIFEHGRALRARWSRTATGGG